MAKLKPWDKLENESLKAYEAFDIYRSIGRDRSLAKVAKKLGKAKQLIERWSSEYNWVDRIAAYEVHMIERKREAEAKEELAEVSKEHKALIKATRQMLTAPIIVLNNKLNQELKKEKGKFADFESRSISQLMEFIEPYIKHIPKLVAVERTLNNMPSEITEHNHNVDGEVRFKSVKEQIESIPEGDFVDIATNARRFNTDNKRLN